MIDQKTFAARRQAVMQEMGEGSIAILSANEEILRNGDAYYRFRQDSDFYYLTGFDEPDAVAVLIPGRAEGEYVLFNRPRDKEHEIWTGRRAGQQGACDQYGANQAFSIDDIEQHMPGVLENKSTLYTPVGRHMKFDLKVRRWVKQVRDKIRSGINAPQNFASVEQLIHPLRLIKSADEIELMRKAAELSSHGHIRAMQKVKPGCFEYELEAELLHEFYLHGCRAPAYDSIVGTGANSCILHYCDNNAQVKDGDLVLIDAGGEYQMYAADITRTFPANGKFSEEQAAIYELVLSAQLAGLEKVKPGTVWIDIQTAIIRVITKGLVDLGILKGDVDDLIEQKTYRDFYMHNSGHWIGIDVHDVGRYKIDNQWRKLQAGMVITVEPGIYIGADNPKVDEKWWNIGVRIEDDVAVTDTGHDVLSGSLPKTLAEIESLMA